MKEHKNSNCSIFMFLFGNSTYITNIYFVLMISITILLCTLHPVYHIFYGVSLNLMKNQDFESTKKFITLMGIISLMNLVFSVLGGYFCSIHGDFLSRKYKSDYYGLILDQDYKWFVGKNLNQVSESAKTHTTKIEEATGRRLFNIVKSLVSIIITYGFAFYINWKIGLALIPTILFLSYTTYLYEGKLDDLSEENLAFDKKQAGYIREIIGKFKTILCFGNFEKENIIYKDLIKENYKINNHENLSRSFLGLISVFIMNLNTVIVIYIGSRDIISDLYSHNNYGILPPSSGQIASILILIWTLDPLVKELVILIKRIADSLASAKHFYNLKTYTEKNKLKNSNKGNNILIYHNFENVYKISLSEVFLNYSNLDIQPTKTGDLEEVDSNISFSFEDQFSKSFDSKISKKIKNEFALSDISVKFEKNRLNYLIGKSGSGKTSVLSLLLKLFKPTNGEIFLNDININDIYDKEYLSLFGYVPQESIFYDLSVKENIIFFRDGVADEKIEEILKLLNLTFIEKMKNGINTKIGTNGCELSGGQRQILSIARALVKSPKILLLDEFTSNLDNILSSEIEKILKDLSKKMIVIIVTHKTNKIDFHDPYNKIVYLEKGKLNKKILFELENQDRNHNLTLSMNENSDPLKEISEEIINENNSDNSQIRSNGDDILKDGEEFNILVEEIKITQTNSKNKKESNLFGDFIKKHKKELIIICLNYFFLSFSLIINGVLFYIITTKLYSNNEDEINYYTTLVCVITIVESALSYTLRSYNMYLSEKIAMDLIHKLRKKMFLWVLNLEIENINDNYKNEIIKIFSEDINMLGPVFSNYIGFFIEIIFTLIIGSILSFIFDWRIGLVCFSFILIMFIFVYIYSDEESLLDEDIIENDYFSDSITNIKLIKAYNLKEKLFAFLISDEENLSTKSNNYNKILHYVFYGISNFLMDLSIVLIFLTGAYFIIIIKCSTIGSFIGSTSNYFSMLDLMMIVTKYLYDFIMIQECVKKLNKIIYKKVYTKNKNKTTLNTEETKDNEMKELNESFIPEIFEKCPSTVQGKIEFRNVTFKYSAKNKTKVLNNVSFLIKPGQKVGFVGSSGSGKSTIIQLLLGFYDVEEGEILLDDISIKNIDKKVLRNLISGVFQEPDLFERSILDNIKYGNLNASKEDLENAVKIACVPLDFFEEENTQAISQISGGQKQRIALARCLLKERNVMFFDEATSALDLKTDREINENLKVYFNRHVVKKTIIVVAHRLSNVIDCDVIFVMREGKIVEFGNHDNLIDCEGDYNQLWNKEKNNN